MSFLDNLAVTFLIAAVWASLIVYIRMKFADLNRRLDLLIELLKRQENDPADDWKREDNE